MNTHEQNKIKDSRKNKTIALVASLVIILAIAVFAYLKINNKTDSTNSSSINQSSNTSTNTNSTNTNTTTASEESDDDEDYTKVVINPVKNIAQNQEAQLVSSADQLVSCGYTRAVTEGPYDVTGTNLLTNNNLNYDNLGGTPLVIAGYVYSGTDNKTPVANAKVEIWHADDSGSYHPNANGAASKYNPSQISLRGYVLTDSTGYYSFTTIYPGEYSGRARHIHVKASIDGYQPIISQIIMSLPGDKMASTEDQIARALDSSCSAPSITNINGVDQGFYNFWLQKN
jgi:protocatechuate 3,4-dioxygenase beta subunit